jgi:hypothetical protein
MDLKTDYIIDNKAPSNVDFIERYYDSSYELSSRFGYRKPSTWFDIARNGLVFDGDSIILFLMSEMRDIKYNVSQESTEDCASIEQVAPSYIIDNSFGRPTLHLLFSVRRYIKQFLDIGYQVKILFFSNNTIDDNMINDGEYKFYQSVIIHDLITLQATIPLLHIMIFPSHNSEEFTSYLRKQHIDLTICEVIILDMNVKVFRQLAYLLTDTHAISVIHLPSFQNISSPADVMDPNPSAKSLVIYEMNKSHATFNDAILKAPILQLDDALNIIFNIQNQIWEDFKEYDQSLCNIVISHAISLCVASTISIKRRFVPNIPSELNTSHISSDSLSEKITKYRKIFFEKILSYNSEILNDESNNHSFIPMDDLWDGRFLAVVNMYCIVNGHDALVNQLHSNHISKIRNSNVTMFNFLQSSIDMELNSNNMKVPLINANDESLLPRRLTNVRVNFILVFNYYIISIYYSLRSRTLYSMSSY